MDRPLLAGIISGVVTYGSAPLVRNYLIRRGTMDVPNHRSSHTIPTPRGGGLACAAGTAAGLILGRKSHVPATSLVGILAVTGIGLADDRHGGLKPRTRLAVQAAGGAVIAPSHILMPFGAVVTMSVVNIVNFMDGINGITASTAIVWGISGATAGNGHQNERVRLLSAITVGSALGFLPWNTPNARLFLGDTGSYLFGSLMSATILDSVHTRGLTWRLCAPLMPYAADSGQAIIRRYRGGERLTEAHRLHSYQRLVDEHNLSHVTVAIIHAMTATMASFIPLIPNRLLQMLASTALLTTYTALPDLLHHVSNDKLGTEA